MIVPDTNLLVYAYDESAARHAPAKRWWEDALSGSEPVGIPWIVALAFTRLLTHPTICSQPLTIEEARSCVEAWFEYDHVRLLAPTDATLRLLFDLLSEAGLGGNLTTDALIAAHALEHGGVVHTADLDFGRFRALRWTLPLQPRRERPRG